MVHWLIQTLRDHPEIAVFLTLAFGFLIGKVKIGKFTLGSVTGVLIAGVLVGQLHIAISSNVKAIFFLMFLFGIGYEVGPQFFQGLKSGGLAQVLFAVIVCVACLLTAYAAAMICGLDVGFGAGLLSGACTISAIMGVATDSINQLTNVAADQKALFLDHMPIAYAVTYLFGTAGSAWFLASIGPKLLRVNLAEECKKLEAQMGATEAEPGVVSAYQQFVVRAYRVSADSFCADKTVDEIEKHCLPLRICIERLRQGEKIIEPDVDQVIRVGDVVAVAARRDVELQAGPVFGIEVDDSAVLDFPAEFLDVVITSRKMDGMTLQELAAMEIGRNARGIFVRRLMRTGVELPITPGTRVNRGDVLQIGGAKRDVERVIPMLGYADRPTNMTDMVFMGLGIGVGAVIGAITFTLGSVPLTLSTSGGTLIAGLVCGWLRSVHPVFGRIPAPALWVFKNVGLCAFIAVVGISAGPGFVEGLKQQGLTLFLAGVAVTLIPLVVGLLVGKYIFKMHPGILLGACAGARTTTAALGAIQEEAQSKVPALGYTVTYAVGNTLLTIWGVIIVMLLH
ncbi:MAG: aspartate-alanine antiporter [Verrucomicrobia bacterium]|nr:aspartate-alanine antiporter [Verrucomicrobiota bacterium]MCG2680777.1 aspartate-alanine antiporter [Kiritimatiellia bacterium]MBU4246806.1 aspartate-alanine antiporter [Verrucomicrobiota bacterium]MBU4291027.1 aspartate-alanine antiporter [Verrucomicrobiota bacterium]MBU4429522.1 aspartate-alanine antiporter [Verrucomicrobiota bacterium]